MLRTWELLGMLEYLERMAKAISRTGGESAGGPSLVVVFESVAQLDGLGALALFVVKNQPHVGVSAGPFAVASGHTNQ